jgi:hypothetical protein
LGAPGSGSRALPTRAIEPSAPHRSWIGRWWVWGIASGIAANGAAVTYLVMLSREDRLTAIRQAPGQHTYADEVAARQSGQRFALATNVLVGVSAVALAGAVYLSLRRSSETSTPRSSVSVSAGAGSDWAFVGAAGRF